MEDSEIAANKNIQFYTAAVNAWFNTAIEHDKSVLALSAAGNGLLITLLTTTGLASAEALLLYVGAILCFLVSIGCILFIFNRNKAYLERIIAGTNRDSDSLLSKLDTVALTAFGAGVTFSVLIGISDGINSYSQGKNVMNDKKVEKEVSLTNESFNNAARLQSQSDLSKSFNNAAKLQPEPTPVTPPADPPATDAK